MLNHIFSKFSDQCFFTTDEYTKSYSDLKKDIDSYLKTLDSKTTRVRVSTHYPYQALIEIFALWIADRTPVLISPKSTVLSASTFWDQIPLEADRIPNEAIILFTSGSKGQPKAVCLSMKNITFQATTFINYFDTQSKEIFFLNLPIHHVSGLMLCMRAFFSGGHISTKSDADFTYISLVPHQLNEWLNNTHQLKQLKNAKAILIGGARFSEDSRRKSEFHQLKTFETYGMTETASFISLNGNILPQREVRVLEDNTISIKGPMLALGYFIDKIFHPINDWFITNDRGEISNNLFIFKGRSDFKIISGGENISPEIIEEVTLSLSGIESVIVTSIPDEKWGELPVLLYTADHNRDEEIYQLLTEKAPPYHAPKNIFKISKTDLGEGKLSEKDKKQLANTVLLKKLFAHQYIESSPDHPTIVILHGFMENRSDWQFLIPKLRGKNNLLLIDLPGHGETNIYPFSSLDEILRRLSDFILLFSTNPILLGYSMGGRISLLLSQKFLNLKGLILISSSFGLTSEEEKANRLKNDLLLFEKIGNEYSLEDFFNEWYSNPMFLPYKNSPQFKKDIERKSKNSYKNWSYSLKFLSPGNFPLRSDFNFPYKHFYISGNEDKPNSPPDSFTYYSIIGAGHNPHKTHPQETLDLIVNILNT